MKGIATTLRDLDRIISGECDDLNEGSREMLVTMLELAHRRAKSPPPKKPDNLVRFPVRRDPSVGNTPSRTSFKS